MACKSTVEGGVSGIPMQGNSVQRLAYGTAREAPSWLAFRKKKIAIRSLHSMAEEVISSRSVWEETLLGAHAAFGAVI